ncbi:hypothetical protein Syun_027520 [Stephania yunnanensis]|uniref:Uncharacterized protein n=1 Tax=Stephania yunnanensis TaxID=152371 RepID=A0AAP0HMW2_9MAGN
MTTLISCKCGTARPKPTPEPVSQGQRRLCKPSNLLLQISLSHTALSVIDEEEPEPEKERGKARSEVGDGPRDLHSSQLASLDGDVFEALVLVKRVGTDVREGRRMQFNYIGRLLREVEPDLMDALIRAMKDGDHNKLQTISNTDWIMEDDDEELDDAESEAEVNYVFMLHLSKPHLYGLMIKMLGKSMEVLEVDKRSLMLSSSSTVVVAVNGSRKNKYTLKGALERFSSEGKVLFKLLHVCVRITTVPTPMGNYIPISPVRDDVEVAYKKGMEWKASKMLLPYKQLCSEKRNYLSSVLIQELFLTWDHDDLSQRAKYSNLGSPDVRA